MGVLIQRGLPQIDAWAITISLAAIDSSHRKRRMGGCSGKKYRILMYLTTSFKIAQMISAGWEGACLPQAEDYSLIGGAELRGSNFYCAYQMTLQSARNLAEAI